jgi:DNA polymerase-3 subunit epsilon/exodeoxyribonuclease X
VLIFLDTETTGVESQDKICSIALILQDKNTIESVYELVNEGKKISPKASSINHITNEMIKNKVAFKDSKAYEILKKHNNPESVLIAHNIKFDLEMLAKSGLNWKGALVDTLRCTKHLIAECEQFSLQFLRYELRLYKDEQKAKELCAIQDQLVAHHALSDALHVKMLYEYLLDYSTAQDLLELSAKNVLLQKFDFGKHAGKYIEEVAINDRAYLEWMLGSIMDLDEDLRYSINYYLEELG